MVDCIDFFRLLLFAFKQLPADKSKYDQRKKEQGKHVQDVGQSFSHVAYSSSQLFAFIKIDIY